jgi:glycosyltransferase involved in cell wall biosynthesis
VSRANILITSVQVPFTRGGAEILVERLRGELRDRDFAVDVVQLPLNAQPKELLLKNIALWQNLDLTSFNGKRVDLVIGTKFPSYTVRHPNKVVWLVHQHRQIYDLYGGRFCDFTQDLGDESLRQVLVDCDKQAISECQGVFTISENVSARLQRYLEISSTPLLPPLPLGQRYRNAASEGYILSVGRLCSIKRIDLIIKALPLIQGSVRLKIVGGSDEPGIEEYLKSEIERHHLWDRVEFLGRVSDEALLELYAKAVCIYYAPHDEDYGFVTLEALASQKPVVTATDSGGVLSFIRHEENGLIVDPHEAALAAAVNRLVNDRELYHRLCANTVTSAPALSWDTVIEELTLHQY